jgi:hypothetical protein
MQTRILNHPVAQRLDFRKRGAKRDCDQAGEKPDEQGSRELAAALLVGAQEAFELTLHYRRFH